MPHHVLIFSLFYYPHAVGGAEIAIKEITDHIGTQEMIFDMITLGGGGERVEVVGKIRVYRVLNSFRWLPGWVHKLLYPWAAVRMARRLHGIQAYDVVWPIMASYAGYAARMFGKCFPQIPIVLTIQEGDHFERREGFLKPLFRSIFTSAHRIQVISKYLSDWSRGMGATCPITIVPNAVDYNLFSRPLEDEEARVLKSRLHKGEFDTFLITTSRLVPKNAVGDIIHALTYLPSHVKLVIVGTGSEEDKLRRMAREYAVDDRVYFLGYIPHREMVKYLKISDIFVRPSLSEGFGNSFIEAMAAGIPVIATNVGGIADFLFDGETGLVCEVKNPKSIAQKVEKLMKDRESRDHIVARAQDMVRQKYEWSMVATDMKELLTKSITERH